MNSYPRPRYYYIVYCSSRNKEVGGSIEYQSFHFSLVHIIFGFSQSETKRNEDDGSVCAPEQYEIAEVRLEYYFESTE